ncbi:MAG: 30S ribosomal protein S20 [Planctomycetota bacterium]
MANTASAKKRVRQNLKRRARNRWRLRIMRDAVKDLETKLAGTSTNDELTASFRAACKVLDRTAQKGVIHKNAAARKKSRLSRQVKAKAQSA